MADPKTTTKKLISCDEAWITYCRENDLYGGMSQGNWLDEARAAHKAGWEAAMEATSESKSNTTVSQ